MLSHRSHGQRGDTIIEVLVAFTVFSMIVVGTITLMNRGTQSAQKALEITLVRQQIDAQAEAIRYVYDKSVSNRGSQFATTWGKMTQYPDAGMAVVPDQINVLQPSNDGQCPERPQHAFILDAHNGTLAENQFDDTASGAELPYAHVYYDKTSGNSLGATGIWVESSRASATADYVDFYIKACWFAPGDAIPTTLGTIVRLYDPTE